jgi:hypothetical protein
MHSPGGVIRCSYRRGLLTNVTVDATKAVAAGDVAISLGGQRVELPATADTITAALGPPLAKD